MSTIDARYTDATEVLEGFNTHFCNIQALFDLIARVKTCSIANMPLQICRVGLCTVAKVRCIKQPYIVNDLFLKGKIHKFNIFCSGHFRLSRIPMHLKHLVL